MPALPETADPVGFAALADRVDATLAAFLDARERELVGLGHDLDPQLAAVARAVRGGKRMRSAFCYWGWRAAGGGDDDAVSAAAASLELLHASALVHDDVMDGSPLRRGHPAAHQAFATLHADRGWSGPADVFGVAAAILTGDLCLAWSDQLFRSSGAEAVARAAPFFDVMRTEVVAGQHLDLVAQAAGEASVAQAMRVIRYKSAKYTVERPLQLGAALAGGSGRLLGALSSYGVPLGEAFQLRDDVLGVFGDPAVTGKPAGDDVREGKRTVLVAKALELGTAEQAAMLRRHLGDRSASAAAVESVREVIVVTGALAAVENLVAELTAAALAALAAAPLADEPSRAALVALADAATRRDV